MRGYLDGGNTAQAAETLLKYVNDAAARAPYTDNILVMVRALPAPLPSSRRVGAHRKWLTSSSSPPPPSPSSTPQWGDDAPLQSPYTKIYPALDAVVALLNSNSSASNITWQYSTPSAWVAALAKETLSGSAPAPPARSVRGSPPQQGAAAVGQRAAAGIPMPSRPAWDALPLVGNEFAYWVRA